MTKKKDIESIYYLSPLQEGLLFHAVSSPDGDPYLVQAGFVLEGRLELVLFERAWQSLVARHPILRTGFVWEGVDQPVQVVRRGVQVPIEHHDFRQSSTAEREAALASLLAADRKRGFDLLKAPLMRLTLIQLADEAWYLINTHHHILLDGWSFAALVREALSEYRSALRGLARAVPAPRPYRDYVSWVRAQDTAAAERFWRDALAGFKAPTPLPMERSTELAAVSGTFPHAEQSVVFSAARTEALSAFARRQRITMNTVIQGAWALLLERHSGQRDVVFGATVAGRSPDLTGSEAMVGLLINTLPVRVSVSAQDRVLDWLARLQQRNGELRQYEWTPLSQVQRVSEVAAGRPLFESLVVFDSYPEEDVELDEAALRVRSLPLHVQRTGEVTLTPGRNSYPLSLIVEPGQELRLILGYEQRRLSHEAAACLGRELCALLAGMVARPEARLAELPRLRAEERERLLAAGQGPSADVPAALVHALFESAAARRPDALALVCEDVSLTYRQLDRAANRLARRLRALGAGPDERVGLCVERSEALIVGLLAVLKAGAAYVPLDPRFPRERLRDVLHDCAAPIVISQARWAEALRDGPWKLLCLDDEPCLAAESEQPLAVAARPENLAYLIYTSGSTGRPKGVAVEHRQLVNYVHGVLARLPIAEDASMALVSTVAADLGHTSLFGALCSGRTLHVLGHERTFDPDAMAEYMARHRIDALKIVPSHLGALLEAAAPERVLPRQCLVVGGEATSPALLARVRALSPHCTVVNHYGPTETTVGALTWQVPAGEDVQGAPPIGHAMANMRAYVLDQHMEPVPALVAGELYLGGAGVARGYHARPGATAERFVPDPFSAAPGARLYRTGDRVCQRSDGAIEFLGRTDHQVKIRGHRVELGEVEAQLRKGAEVRDALVVVRDLGGARRLIGYVVARAAAHLDTAALLAELATVLPDYMLPSELVQLAALPLNENGKVERSALPEPGAPQASQVAFVAPRNEAEATLAAIWAAILGVERVGVHDNFFALGGDSIRSLQVIARANQRGFKLKPKHLFAHPTIAAAVAVAHAQSSAQAELSPAPASPEPCFGLLPEELERVLPDRSALEDAYPLSPMQEGMLFHTLMNPGSGIYLMQQHYEWNGPLDMGLLVQAWRSVVARHPMLRTCFLWQDLARPLQVVHKQIPVSEVIYELDLRGLPVPEQRARVAAELLAELREGFDMARAPLMRIRVVRTGEQAYQIVRSFHHILTDDWCFSVLMMECLSYYAALRDGRELELPMPRPYRDYIAWLERKDLAAAERFWREELKGFLAPTPLGIERAVPERGDASRGVGDELMELSVETSSALQALAQEHALTPNTFVQGAWALLLSRYSGQRDVLMGVTVAGRPTDLPGVESIVGLFINSLPLRVRVTPHAPLLTWLKDLLARNYRLREFEYPPLLRIQQWSELPKGEALFKSLVVFENAPVDARLGEQVSEAALSFGQDRVHTNYPLTVVAYPGPRLGIRLSYDRRWLAEEGVRRMLGHLARLLEEMVHRPQACLEELCMLGELERRALLETWNETPSLEPAAQTYVAQLERQVERTPDAVAVTCRGRRLSYAALNHAANQVAAALRAAGIGPDRIVAVLDTRDLELVSAALGVLKAGGAYLPLDPGHPEPRLAQVLASSRASVVLTSEAWLPKLARACELWPEEQRPRLVVRERLPSRRGKQASPVALAGPGQLAYVIYTSGSTGVPKGAMVEHAGMLNNVWGKVCALALDGSDVIGQTASQCFDISVWQLLTPLLCGARVHIVPDEVVRDPHALLQEAAREGITVLELVPALLRGLLEAEPDAPVPARLRWVLPTGEALPPELCRLWFQRHPQVPLLNAYGPAECADDVALHCLREAPAQDVVHTPIGRPVPHVQLYVLSGDHLAPVGVAGELCIGGVGVGRGYLHDPARTAEAFVPHPFARRPGERLYRSGDMVRRLSDGSLEFLGRRDHQVKVRGYRIELGEIEGRLLRHPDVRESVVTVQAQAAAENRLVAYVVWANPEPGDVAELRRHLQRELPEYMVPSAFVSLGALPRSENGKIDRLALPLPELSSELSQAQLPRTPHEEAVARIWAEVLKLPQVGVHTSFFELGGHSLLATQVISRLRRAFGLELPLRAVFEHNTVAQLAEAVQEAMSRRASSEGLPPITQQPRAGKLPLSFAQQRLWFVEEQQGERGLLTMPFALRLTGTLDVAALRASFQAVIARHEVLRSAFVSEHGEPAQRILAALPFELLLVDLTASGEAQLSAELARCFAARFDLTRPPLLRARLFRTGSEEHVLAVAMHHIVADGWSLSVLVEDLMTAYRAHGEGRDALEVLAASRPLQYADYALWQRQHLTDAWQERELSHWRGQLGGASTLLRLPGARLGSGASRTVARLRKELPGVLARALERRGSQQGVTPFMQLHSALALVVHQQTGRTDFLLGTDVANRQRQELEGVVGFFINQLVLRTKLEGLLQLSDLVAHTRRVALDAYQHQELPFDRLVAALRPERHGGHAPFFQLKLVLQNARHTDLRLPGLSVRELELAPEDVELDLLVNVTMDEQALHVVYDYRAELYPAGYVAELHALFARALELLVEPLDRPLAEAVDLLGREAQLLAQEARASSRAFHEEQRKGLGVAQRRRVAVQKS